VSTDYKNCVIIKITKKGELMKNILIFSAVFFTIGAVYAGLQMSYRVGYKTGVERTESCMDNWGKMKHDGWDFYCLH
jgi:hypothetical protein